MKRYFLIFLLLISFNANAIAGSVMMLDMAAMASSMMEASSMQHDHTSDTTHVEMLGMSSDHCQSQPSANDNCDEHNNCGACLAHCSAALMTEISVFNSSHRFTFESVYRLWDAPSTYSRLLRPPKFA